MQHLAAAAALLACAIATASAATTATTANATAANATTDFVYYDSFNASVLTSDQVAIRDAEGTTYYCVNAFPACSALEARRLDGSCTSLRAPPAGAGHAPFLRLLPANFTNGTEPRLAVNGSALPNPRWLRTRALAEGRVAAPAAPATAPRRFNAFMLLYFSFAAADIAAINVHEMLNYISVHPHCCSAAGAADPVCYPIAIPADDPVHRFSGERCLNMTRPISFQSSGCLPAAQTPMHKLNYGTPLFDLSVIYGNDAATSARQRVFAGGQLNSTASAAGLPWPQYVAPAVNRRDGIQGLSGVNFPGGLWWWREHNRVAAALAALNPCWGDERLFRAAREINIATYAQITYYELFALLMGKKSLVRGGVLGAGGASASFRDPYDEAQAPAQYLEPLLGLRWVHTIQPATLRLHTAEGAPTPDEYSMVTMTLAATSPAADTNLTGFTNGAYRSPTAAYDNIVDPDVAEVAQGQYQRLADALSSDLMRTRLLGVPPYARYLELCDALAPGEIDSWDALAEYLDKDKVLQLSQMYNEPSDVDLMVGLWLEGAGGARGEGAALPPTLRCLLLRQLQRTVRSDRHWFERAARPDAFTEEQLLTIRNATAARLLCDNGDSVASIQPSAFEMPSKSNAEVACSELPAVDLTRWRDAACAA